MKTLAFNIYYETSREIKCSTIQQKKLQGNAETPWPHGHKGFQQARFLSNKSK